MKLKQKDAQAAAAHFNKGTDMLFLKKNDKELYNISLSNLQSVLVRNETRLIYSKYSIDLEIAVDVDNLFLFLKLLENKFDIITKEELAEHVKMFFGKEK